MGSPGADEVARRETEKVWGFTSAIPSGELPLGLASTSFSILAARRRSVAAATRPEYLALPHGELGLSIVTTGLPITQVDELYATPPTTIGA